MAKPQPQLKPKKKKKSTSTNGNNNKAPPSYFFPNSPTTVGSPKDNGFYLRQVRQRTPNKLCTLVLPPPLISLFDPNANGDVAAAAGATNHRISVAASSDNASLDGTSIIDNAQAHSSSSVRHQHQIQHNNQGQGGGAYNISSNASAVSASVASVGGGNNAVVGQHHNPHLPLHLRVGMASCDPLIVFDGRFVLVATCDGRIAIYSIVDFDTNVSGVSDDVMASERRRCAEWKEEEEDDEQCSDEEEKKKDEPKGQTTKTLSSERNTSYEILPDAPSVQEEESEWDMRDRMHRRERAKQLVEPMLIVTLPKTNYGPTDSGHDQSQPMNSSSSSIKHDEESSIVGTAVHGEGGIATPPAIVAMCATPGTGESLVEQRDIVNDDTAATTTEGQTNKASVNTFKEGHCIPTFGASLLGHVAVLTDDGEVHVIEILENKTTSRMSDSHGSDMANINNHPTANTIVSFRTGHLGATCICMHQLPSTVSSSNQQAMHLRLCVGHQSGILAAFQVYSTLVYHRERKDRASPMENVSSVKYFQGEECQQGSSGVDPLDVSYSKSQRHHLRANTTDLTNLLGQLSSSPAVSPEKSTPRISNYRSAPNTENSKANKSLHRTYGFHRTCSEPIASFDPGKNEAPSVIGPAKVLLCWKGRYDTPVKAVSSPGWEQTTERTENAKVQDALLVVGIEQCQREDPSQSSMKAVSPDSSSHYSLSPAISLEVMNATLAEQFWDQIKQSEPFDPYKCISFYDCSVWPAAGKEIKDGWMRGSSMRRGVDPRDKLFGMLGLQRTSVTNKLCCFEGPNACFASASSDGTVAISHLDPKVGWGVMKEENQLMLFQRCIGLGTCNYLSKLDEATRYIVCCLRGGTIYLVPIAEQEESGGTERGGSENEITVFDVPIDPNGDDDGLVRFVQNFTAGLARAKPWIDLRTMDSRHMESECTMKSVALVGWSGGILDVYEVTPAASRNDAKNALLSEIVNRGVATKLVEKLLGIERSHSLLTSDLWRKAWDECHELNSLDDVLEGIKDTPRGDFSALRSLLLSLAG